MIPSAGKRCLWRKMAADRNGPHARMGVSRDRRRTEAERGGARGPAFTCQLCTRRPREARRSRPPAATPRTLRSPLALCRPSAPPGPVRAGAGRSRLAQGLPGLPLTHRRPDAPRSACPVLGWRARGSLPLWAVVSNAAMNIGVRDSCIDLRFLLWHAGNTHTHTEGVHPAESVTGTALCSAVWELLMTRLVARHHNLRVTHG